MSVEALPPLAPDACSISAVGLDPEDAYQYALDLSSLIYRLSGSQQPGGLRANVEAVEKQLGVKFHDDLVASLAGPIVVANAPSEGPFSMGTTVAVKVKDAKKLARTLETLINSLGAVAGTEVYITKQKYRGAEINMIHFGGGNGIAFAFPFSPTYTIHDGWLVAALYPQPVKGYIFRARPGIARWRPSPLVAQAIDAERRYRSDRQVQIVGLGESDQRPTLNSLLGMAPLAVAMIGSFGRPSGAKPAFDPSLIPNAQAITERVRPGVSLVVDDGDSLRVETYATLPLGFQLTGLDIYAFAFIPSLLFSGF